MKITIIILLIGLVLLVGCSNSDKYMTREEYDLLQENKKLGNQLLAIGEQLSDLKMELCGQGFNGFEGYCTTIESYYCDEDGELNCKDWRGKMICENKTCNSGTSLGALNAYVYYITDGENKTTDGGGLRK